MADADRDRPSHRLAWLVVRVVLLLGLLVLASIPYFWLATTVAVDPCNRVLTGCSL